MRGNLVVEGGDRAREAGVDGDVDHVSQRKFAAVLGVSARTLQDWEQGRRKPTGAARSLLAIATKRPDILREVLAA
jgi:DNA-binding transcriptional regulator YdaS (Cro superfamily)